MFVTADGRLQPVWAFVLSAILSAGAFYVCAALALAIAGDRVLLLEFLFRPLLALVLLALFSWLLTTADHVEDHRLGAMGLPWARGAVRQFLSGSVLGLTLVVVAVIPIIVWGGGLTIDLRTTSRTLPRLIAVLIVLISGSLAEELMFRGYPFQHLAKGIGSVGAIVVFSLLFGVVHWLNPGASVWGLVNTILIGVLLAVAYLRTRALWLPWGIHFAWNATLGLLLGLPVSGLRIFNVAVRGTARGPRWLTGGSYGIEASATAAVVILFGLAALWKWPVARLHEPVPASQEPVSPDSVPGI
jgi:membrane protease YdiL (CAAX protease family)